MEHTSLLNAFASVQTGQSVDFNLGTIGHLHSHQVSRLNGSPAACSSDRFGVVARAHAGLPRPGRDLECHLLTVAECPTLRVLAATNHSAAYYVIVNLAGRSTQAALRSALEHQRLELVFAAEGDEAQSTAMHFGEEVASQLRGALQTHQDAWQTQDESWRDRLGMLVLALPALLKAAEPQSVRCTQHSVVLASNGPAKF
jgi:hypothetical protein